MSHLTHGRGADGDAYTKLRGTLQLNYSKSFRRVINQEEVATVNKMGGGHHVNPEAIPRADQDVEALKKALVPIAFRDTCGHLLIPLNKCRRETWWNPNKCGHLRHTYEECLYNSYLQRVEAKVQQNKVLAARAAEEE